MTHPRVISCDTMKRGEAELEGHIGAYGGPLGTLVDRIGTAIRQGRHGNAFTLAKTLAAAAMIVAEREASRAPRRYAVFQPDSGGQAACWYQGAFGPNYRVHVVSTVDAAAIYDDKDEAERVASSLNSRDEYRNSYAWQVWRLAE